MGSNPPAEAAAANAIDGTIGTGVDAAYEMGRRAGITGTVGGTHPKDVSDTADGMLPYEVAGGLSYTSDEKGLKEMKGPGVGKG